MLDDAGGAKITLPATTVSEEQLRLMRKDWWRRHFFDAQVAMCKGQPDEKDVRDFFNEYIPWFANTGIPVPAERGIKRCLAIADGKTRRLAVDFLAGFYLFENRQYAAAARLLRTVADAPANAPLPILARILAQAMILNHSDHHEKAAVPAAENRYFQLLADQLSAKCGDEDAEILISYHLASPLVDVWKGREERYLGLYKNSKIPDWARFTLGGAFEVSYGWREIGRGMVPLTDEKLAASFAARNERARELLTEAWRLRPTSRWAAQQMIYVIRHGHGAEGDTLRLWVDRALAACCDYDYAAAAYLTALRPRWGGDYESMLAFGRACAETKRYDTSLPTFLNRSISYVAADLDDWRSVYRASKFTQLLMDTREKCMFAAKTDSGKLIHLSFLFYEAWACGDYQRANKALISLPRTTGPFTHRDADRFAYSLSQDPVLPMHDTVIRASPAREAYEKGLAALDAGRPAEARAQFKAALAPAGEPGRIYLNAELVLADFQERFASGEWTAVPLHERFCWNFSEGRMEWLAAEKRARFTSNWEFGKILFRGALGDSYEVRGHFVPTRPEENRRGAGLGVFCGHSPDTCGRAAASWWVGRVDTRNATQMTMDFDMKYGAETKLRKQVNWAADTTFLMRRQKGRITFQVGSQELQTEIPADAPGGSGAFGLGLMAWPQTGFCDIWSVEARKLPESGEVGNPRDRGNVTPPRIAVPVTPAPNGAPAEKPKPAAEVAAGLVGTWRFKWDQNGWSATRTFMGDGTFTAEGAKGTGKWEVAGDRILVNFADGAREEIFLPLDPKGTKVIGYRKRVLSAVKERP